MHFVYILQSQKDGSFYIGYSANVEQRLRKHNSAKSGYTATKQPWSVVYQEAFEQKSEALSREKFLKRQKNRSFYQRLVDDYNG